MKTQYDRFNDVAWKRQWAAEMKRNREHKANKKPVLPRPKHDEPDTHTDTFVYADPDNLWNGNTIPW